MPRSMGALFFIGPAIRGGRITPADDSGQHDNRKQVRQPCEEVVVDTWISLLDTGQERAQVARGWGEADRYTDGLGSHKEERAAEGAERCPTPEDHRCEGNEPPAGRHVVLERAGGLQGKIGTGQAGKNASHQNVTIAKLDDIDADRVRSLWVLPNCTRSQTPA